MEYPHFLSSDVFMGNSIIIFSRYFMFRLMPINKNNATERGPIQGPFIFLIIQGKTIDIVCVPLKIITLKVKYCYGLGAVSQDTE